MISNSIILALLVVAVVSGIWVAVDKYRHPYGKLSRKELKEAEELDEKLSKIDLSGVLEKNDHDH